MAASDQRPMGAAEWAMLLALSLLWGSSFFFYKVLVASIPPMTVVLGRAGLAALVLDLALLLRGDRTFLALPWGQFVVLGVLNTAIPFALIAWSETRITSGLASLLNAATPAFTVLAARIFVPGTRLGPGRVAGVAFGMLGVAVLVGPTAWRHPGGASLPGEIACVLAAMSYGLGGIYSQRFRALPPMRVAAGQLTAAGLVMLPVAALSDRFWTLPAPPLAAWGALAGVTLLGTVAAYLLFFRILATAGATNIVLVTFLLPVTALALGAVALGEWVEPRALGGMALIALGLAAIDGRPVAALRALRGGA